MEINNLIKENKKTIGICGLYSLDENSKDELWLGWFGIIKEYRSKGHGSDVLKQLEIKAKEANAHTIYSYVNKKGKPLDFYYRNGFKRVGTVKEYLEKTKFKFDKENFEDLDDHVIKKKIK